MEHQFLLFVGDLKTVQPLASEWNSSVRSEAPDGQIPPNGQNDGQPDGDGVADDREVSMEQGKQRPTVCVDHLFGGLGSDEIMDCERNIRCDDTHVGDRHSGQY